jgi:hypothetical protein
VRAFFDTVPWEKLTAAVAYHTDQKWVLMYVEPVPESADEAGRSDHRAWAWLRGVRERSPGLFAHWALEY